MDRPPRALVPSAVEPPRWKLSQGPKEDRPRRPEENRFPKILQANYTVLSGLRPAKPHEN